MAKNVVAAVKREHAVYVRVDVAERIALIRAAREKGCTTSEFVRQLIRRELGQSNLLET